MTSLENPADPIETVTVAKPPRVWKFWGTAVWGLLIFVVVPPLQIRVVEAASEGPNLAATLNQGAFNVGNAGGAWIGGVALSAGVTYAHLPLVGAVLALLAVAVAVLSQALERSAPVTTVQAPAE